MTRLGGILSALLGAALLSVPRLANAADFTQEEINSGTALKALAKQAFDAAWERLPESGEGCTRENVEIRKEWREVPGEDRIAYTDALQCLMERPSIYDSVDGAKSKWDDFAVLHYYQTPFVHNSATFLLFHRYYIWTLEKTLKEECGYKGTIPYWEWGLDCEDPRKSPMFDGSPTSMGSDGASDPNGAAFGFGFSQGTGGGCVMEGPFVNMSVNIGPTTQAAPLQYNPRCLKRDLNGDICRRWASITNTTDAILDSPDIELFQAIVQGDSRYPESRGLGLAVHGGGHYIISGDPGGDFYFSPLEPAFFQHHGQIDRMYFIWQNLDWENRQNIAGTGTMMNIPPSDEVDIDETLDLQPLEEVRTLRSLIDTSGGDPFCFLYQ